MPKMKTRRGAAKRFKVTGSGRIKRNKANHRHMLIRRSNKAKQAFYKKVAENLSADPGVLPENILITIVENHDIDWSFRDGITQFVV